MFTRLSSQAGRKASATAAHPVQEPAVYGPEDWSALLARGELASCCAARPTVIAVFPRQPGQSRTVELLLCGHHYRTSRASLVKAGAVIHFLPPG
jgi:hypothetical protein